MQPLEQVADICVDGTSATTLLCSENGKPLTTALMYHDQSSLKQAELIRKYAPRNSLANGPGSSLAKALQLYQDLEDTAINPDSDIMLQHQADWITGQLTGQSGNSDENNAMKAGYDIMMRRWPDWIQSILPRGFELPDVRLPGNRLSHQTSLPAQWQDMGFSGNVIVRVGTTDSTAAFLASKTTNMQTGATTLGSTLVIKQLSHKPFHDMQSGIYSHRIGDIWLVGGASNTGCAVINQFFTLDQIKFLSKQIDPQHPSDLNYYPLPDKGERFPVYDPDMLPRLSPRPRQDRLFLQGLMEGIAKIEKIAYQRLQGLGCGSVNHIISTGGGAKNTVWQQLRQRIIGINIELAQHNEAAYGSALLAHYGESCFDRLDH